MNNKLKLCYFGTYDRSYTSNKLVLDGLSQIGVSVLEVNSEVKITTMIKKEDLGPIALIKRVLKKYKIIGAIVNNFDLFKKCDCIYVGYPGHFDVLIAYPISKIFRKKLIFNPLLIFYTGFSEEQGILNKKSLIGKLAKFGESKVYQMCDLVLADTDLQKKYLINEMNVDPKKIRTLPLGADDRYYKYSPYKNSSKKINVCYYGLYSPIHGVEYLVDAAYLLRNDTDITFSFVGQGNTFPKTFARVKELGLKNITFYNDIPVEKHPEIIEKSDIFVGFFADHPSVKRVVANKMYQGLSLGKVVLTADSPVLRSLFKHKETMYYVPPANGKMIADAISELKENPDIRKKMAEGGHSLFIKEYTPKAVAQKMVGYINEIL